MRRVIGFMLVAITIGAPVDASAGVDLWPFRTKADRFIDQARDARVRSDLRAAASLLDEADAEPSPPKGRILHERGLLARERGMLEEAAVFLGEAADLAPNRSAREDRAGVLVQLGRWPEAVTVLRKAFNERGSAMGIDNVVVDQRFVKLAEFKPFRALVEKVREEQAGPLGRLALRLERIEMSAVVAKDILERVAAIVTVVWRVGSALGVPVLALLLLGLLFTFGVNQLGVLQPPWTLVVGMLGAATVWHLGTRVVTADVAGGWHTIGIALGIVTAPWLVAVGLRQLWRWRRESNAEGCDPFAAERLDHTLSLVSEVARLGEKLGGIAIEDREVAAQDLERAGRSLSERLSGQG